MYLRKTLAKLSFDLQEGKIGKDLDAKFDSAGRDMQRALHAT